jgi:multicomponent Na+:H+ antiporter subunit G
MIAPHAVIAGALAALGLLAMIAGAIGVLRFADVYERLHALRAASFGAPLLLIAFALEAPHWSVALKLLLLAGALAMSGPVLAHLIAHAAHRGGIEPAGRRTEAAP